VLQLTQRRLGDRTVQGNAAARSPGCRSMIGATRDQNVIAPADSGHRLPLGIPTGYARLDDPIGDPHTCPILASPPRRSCFTRWLTCDAEGVTIYGVRFEGPAVLALGVAKALADADGVELISSDQPWSVDDNRVAMNVTVEAAFDAVADAVATIRGDMPPGTSIEINVG
jgi:hypothetical protein